MISISSAFNAFREELDAHHDRRERLIKASRDITNLSKKTIFLLHRLALESLADADNARQTSAAAKGYANLREVQSLYAGLRNELVGDRFWRYHQQVSPGLQEYIEALSFTYFLEHRSLIPFEAVQRSLSDEDHVPYLPLTTSDYLLGLSDLTGELMRLAISGIAQRGGRKQAMEICTFVRNCKADFEGFTPHVRELSKKQAVTSSSLEKIEDAAYAIVLRGSEYDLPPEMLDDIVASTIAQKRHDFGMDHSEEIAI
ncbi:hypothetical protein EYR40_004273 [Pleurotus pulmonarius]|nr:hypothetical protein EYR40_004273 [Pleurotus pulmonarius]KAF4606978.1 hypothetical protein EYR38_001033 [Pleurotus pulmonarius]